LKGFEDDLTTVKKVRLTTCEVFILGFLVCFL